MSQRAVRQKFTAAMHDVKYNKRLYCYLKRSHTSSRIKREMRRRIRHRTIEEGIEDGNSR
jgi:hypothetical protein